MSVTTKPGASAVTPDRVGPTVPVPKLKQPGRTRRPLMLAFMVVTIVIGALGAYWLVNRSAERISVVGMADDVAWGSKIESSDLIAVSVVVDPALRVVPWEERTSLIGQLAATDLQAGSLVTARAVMGEPIPGPGQALVGVNVNPKQLPVTDLVARDQVLLVVTGASGNAAAPDKEIEATVFKVGESEAGGSRTVDVLVPAESAGAIATAAAGGFISIVLVPRG